ncbi:MAG: hypothetical protein AMJ68_02300 [Acidithiobacillales bacterium SG8_45]|nr:MAG: hypothetical protein AMJ68_02300 [Acidithiobacillales bacterium SG8_45]
MTVNTRKIHFLFLTVFLVHGLSVNAHILEAPPGYDPHTHKTPHQVIAIFLEAVDRGELHFFGKPLSRIDINPIRVEYVYELDQSTPTITIYSEFTRSMTIPGQTDCTAKAISAVMDSKGHIIDSTLHVWPKGLSE